MFNFFFKLSSNICGLDSCYVINICAIETRFHHLSRRRCTLLDYVRPPPHRRPLHQCTDC